MFIKYLNKNTKIRPSKTGNHLFRRQWRCKLTTGFITKSVNFFQGKTSILVSNLFHFVSHLRQKQPFLFHLVSLCFFSMRNRLIYRQSCFSFTDKKMPLPL